MKVKILVLFLFMHAAMLHAQDVTVTGKVKGTIPAGMRIYLLPIGSRQANPDTMAHADGRISATVGSNAWGLYDLVTVYNRQQAITPLHVTADNGKAQLNLSVSNGVVALTKPDRDNRALAAFNDAYAARSKRLWLEGRNMSNEQQKALINGYPALADSIVGAQKPSETVAQYLRMWAQVQRFEAATSMMYASGHQLSSVGFDLTDLAKETLPKIDNPMAALFDGATTIALRALGSKDLKTQLTAIRTNLKDTALRARSEEVTMKRWLATFDYGNRYTEGEQELTALTSELDLDSRYLAEFKTHKAAIKAAPFPQTAKLYDADGNAVNFSQFAGKWVYIDMWASWCVPCIKEVPYLKQLEKDLEGSNVVFVSISVDTNRDSWKKKMAQLGLSGNQFINDDGSLGNALNVKAIPRFLIYDPEGRLYDDNATRPSDERTKERLQGLK